MTREEKKKLQLQIDQDFIDNLDRYTKMCFDTTSIFYNKMQKILESTKNRELTHEVGFELHHRIPRSFFKKINQPVVDTNNLYKLTYAQHFIVHYYAYLCATPLMKPAMSLTLVEMKKMCTKVDGCTESDILNMSNLFNNIKYDLSVSKQKDKTQSLSTWNKKLEKNQLYIQEPIRDPETNQFTDCIVVCKRCEKAFKQNILEILNNPRCENCEKIKGGLII